MSAREKASARRLAPRPALTFSLAAGALALLGPLAIACEPQTDLVAVAPPRQPPLMREDAGRCLGPACCDATSCGDAQPPSGPACEAGACEPIDAGCDAASCEPAPPPVCEPLACDALAARAAYCALAPRTPSVQIGDGCEPMAAPSFRFAVCCCAGGLVADRHPLQVDVLSGAAEASLAVNGNLRLGADVEIAGSVYVSGDYSTLAGSPPQVRGQVVTSAAPACDCDPAKLLDVAAVVAARSGDHDDASIPIDPAALNGFTGRRSLSLDCGRYYFTRVAGDGPLEIEARGRVAIFISGNVELGDSLTVTLAGDASVELFVTGDMTVVGSVALGAGRDGNRVLLAVGGDGNIQLNSDVTIDGSIYAPRAALVTQGTLELHGAMFVRYANLDGLSRVHYQPLGAVGPACRTP